MPHTASGVLKQSLCVMPRARAWACTPRRPGGTHGPTCTGYSSTGSSCVFAVSAHADTCTPPCSAQACFGSQLRVSEAAECMELSTCSPVELLHRRCAPVAAAHPCILCANSSCAQGLISREALEQALADAREREGMRTAAARMAAVILTPRSFANACCCYACIGSSPALTS